MKNNFYKSEFLFSRFSVLKKSFFIFIILIFCITNFFAEENFEASQVVLPIEVFVGDKVEVRYTFSSSVDFFSKVSHSQKSDSEHFKIQNPFENLKENFIVVESEIYRIGTDYTIRFVIVPWSVGQINFPPFYLSEVLDGFEDSAFTVALFPVEVKSIVEKTGKNQIMPPVPPMIIPGTTYILFFLILLILILLILFFRILLRFNLIKQKWLLYLQKRAYKKNAEDAMKKIKKILKSNLSDIEFSKNLQFIIRGYLDFRFDYKFSATSSNAIFIAFEKICAGKIPLEILDAVQNICAIFLRTDYIRFAHDSIDLNFDSTENHKNNLLPDERKSLCEMFIKSIEDFESDEKQSEEE